MTDPCGALPIGDKENSIRSKSPTNLRWRALQRSLEEMRTCALWVFGLLLACGKSSTPEPAAPPAATETPSPPIPDEAPPAEPEPPAEPAPPEDPDPLTLGPDASTSIGSPTEGSVNPAVALPLTGAGYLFNPRKDPARRHGTVELVQALVRSAAAVHEALPGNDLIVGDLSMPTGGDIPGHASHRAGRDVDVMFYLLDDKGQPFPAKAIPLEPDGRGVDYQDLTKSDDDVAVRLDVPRTWAFVEALVSNDAHHINRIFVVEHVRGMLLAHAKKSGASKSAMERFGHLACQPKFPHDDHMHIRFYCEPDDIKAGCLDTKPFFPWHTRALSKQGVKPKLAGRRKSPAPKLTSVADAAKKAEAKVGGFAPEVSAFLERRKAWAKKPHPGRKWCK